MWEGYASEQIVYDEKDRYTQVAYFDASGQPCSLDYPAKIIFAYDQKGNEAKRAYLDKEGRLSSDNAYQYAIVAYRYNDRGNRLEEAYYDENEQLCMTQNNYAKASYEYNVFGNVTRIDYYGTDGAPVLTNAGYTAKPPNMTAVETRSLNLTSEQTVSPCQAPKIARAGRSINMTPLVLK